ncbi:cGMP-specific 3',5'-cyclic phosphodiesterase isoform X3 [Lingula anatina]|uniref:Phosphodiesterase n=1 Tax=Lingula anatina TaxID=7574 RepID=A0A1S3GY79_LINAN|nr:cGMP-specific 3',5'-cyclic phosphodiesterase isoform X3 [Lingula anatina]|eukprot:XP_013378617.1 cGMP-specific 3',5'-cyclic phosphodiesterase isoform X3 [Lingula anatina]
MAATTPQVTREAVEYYLSSNLEFTSNWIVNNATDDMIHQWKVRRGWLATHSAGGHDSDLLDSPTDFPSMLSSKNSITENMFKNYISGNRKFTPRPRKMLTSLRQMSERELFMELIRDIANELDVNVLCHKILANVSTLTNSDRGSLFLARGSKNNRYLVSKLFDVTESSTLEDTLQNEENEIRVPVGKGIAGHVALTKETVNIKNAYEDPRFNNEVDLKTGYKTHSILCMPILNYEGDVIGVAQIINKRTGDEVHEFTEDDVEVFKNYLTFCGIGITNAQLFELSVEEYKRNQMLLKLARGIFEEQSSLEKLVQKIMIEAQELLRCERCSVYLIEEEVAEEQDPKYLKRGSVTSMPEIELISTNGRKEPKDIVFAKAFDLFMKDKGTIRLLSEKDLVNSKNAEIARYVASTHETLNISDVQSDTRFSRQEGTEEEEDGFQLQNMLCMPIYNSQHCIIGITQLMNKMNKHPFYERDMNMFEAFAIFCGLGIHNTQMYENAVKLSAKQSVALEVLSYHAMASKEETAALKNSHIPSAKKLNLYSFDFDDLPLGEDLTLQATIRMFLELDLVNKFHLSYEVLCRWLCSVRKNYRPVTYHNWRHAFNVAQTMFTMFTTGKMRNMLTDLEVIGLIVACLCHDLDHRGTNNAFQLKVDSPLAVLYSTSTMEHHHFDHSILILNSEGNNIFENLSPEDYRKVIKILESAILATDLALYFKKRGNFQTLVERGEKKFVTEEKKELLRNMMMTACDVSAITKPWPIQQRVAKLVASEFFEQGDIEKSQLNLKPHAMMDREKEDELPKMQVGFIDAICMPLYKMLAQLKPSLQHLHSGCVSNRKEWQSMADGHEVTAKKQQQNGSHAGVVHAQEGGSQGTDKTKG